MELPRSSGQHRIVPADSTHEGSPTAIVPPALPNFGCHLAVARPPVLLCKMQEIAAGQLPFGCTCRAIAQTKPTSSRAIAAVATEVTFPAQMSLRYRRHSRSCAFHAISRMGLARRSCRTSSSRLIRAGKR